MDAAINKTLRKIRQILAASSDTQAAPFEAVNRSFARAQTLVRFYYLASLYFAFKLMLDVGALTREADSWSFLWPLAWAQSFETTDVLRWLSVACFLSSLLALQFWQRRSFRFLFVLLFLPVFTTTNSLGGINHTYHAWFWIGVCLVFLPDPRGSEARRPFKMAYLTVIAATQALLLSFYTLAGSWKFLFGLQGLVLGYPGNFAPRGLASTLAGRQLQADTDPLLAEIFIANYWLSWPLFLAMIYIQLVAVLVTLRPRLHILWGYALISFHLGTYLLMEIGFLQHVLILALFFVMSPFRPEQWTLREVLADLPVFGLVFRRILRTPSRGPAPYPKPAQ